MLQERIAVSSLFLRFALIFKTSCIENNDVAISQKCANFCDVFYLIFCRTCHKISFHEIQFRKKVTKSKNIVFQKLVKLMSTKVYKREKGRKR